MESRSVSVPLNSIVFCLLLLFAIFLIGNQNLRARISNPNKFWAKRKKSTNRIILFTANKTFKSSWYDKSICNCCLQKRKLCSKENRRDLLAVCWDMTSDFRFTYTIGLCCYSEYIFTRTRACKIPIML